MKNYTRLSEQYCQANGLKKVYIRSTVGELLPHYLTQKAIDELKGRNVQVHASK